MKFLDVLKVLVILFLTLSQSVLSLKNVIAESRRRRRGGGNPSRPGGKSPGAGAIHRPGVSVTVPGQSNKISNSDQQNYDNMNNSKEKNFLLLNTEVLNSKPRSDKEDSETQVYPQQANAGSEFRWNFMWWHVMHFPASNALRYDSSYWLSARGREHDHWEAVFSLPQKLDLIEIRWRLPPKRFRVFFKLDEKEDYIPVTEVVQKTSYLTKEGKIRAANSYSEYNAIVFNKPIFARRIRINLNEPIKKQSFSIFSVKFFQKKTTLLIKNELLDEATHYCFYVNTDIPMQNSKVEAYPCLQALALANNNELWVHNTDSTVRHLNSNLCLGFNVENDLVLRECGVYNPGFTVQIRNDDTLFFTGYEQNCLVMDEKKKVSNNLITENTDVILTSQADAQTYKKENIKFMGGSFWHSTPGQKKATIQILFGKIKSGVKKGKYESKKIDLIQIDWIKPAKKFMVYTWKPGYSWTLRQTFENYSDNFTEIQIVGEDAAALMLVLEESNSYPEFGNIAAYAIKEVIITYNSIKLKNDNCSNYKDSLKIFDFDPQNYRKLKSMPDYIAIRKKLSNTYEKSVANYKNMKLSFNNQKKTEMLSKDLTNKLTKLKSGISGNTIKSLRNFKSDQLPKISNSVFLEHVRSKGPTWFLNSVTRQAKKGGLGTKSSPAKDCLSLKRLKRNSLSGWYFIQGECNPKPLRVFCDFTIQGEATDFFIFNDGQSEPNSDLSHLGITDFNSVRYQCAKNGLHPIQINNRNMVKRIYDLLKMAGYNLSKEGVVPLGYDYSCRGGRCSGVVNSLNDKQSPAISSFFFGFLNSFKTIKSFFSLKSNTAIKSEPFAGLGQSSNHSIIKFDATNAKITALICSTNHIKTDSSDLAVKPISCDTTPLSNVDLFSQGANILVECPTSCANTNGQVMGTNIYHFKSSVCKAAIHSQIIGSAGGKFYVRVGQPSSSYQGSVTNGIISEDYNEKDGLNSISFLKYKSQCPINQFAELVKKEEENNATSSDGNSNFSSFIQTSMKLSLSEANNQIENELNSNELDAVDIEDIQKAGIKANEYNLNKLNEPDTDQEDYIYNKSGNVSEEDTPSTNSDLTPNMIKEVNNLVDYNNQNGMTDNELNLNDSNYDQNDSENSALPESGNEYSFSQVEGGLGRDRLTTEEKQHDMVSNMLSDIKQAKETAQNMANKALGDEPQVRIPPPNLPQAPHPKPSHPPEPEEPKKPSNKRTEPTTDDGNRIMMKIRKTVDWDYLDGIKNKNDKIKNQFKLFQNNMSWSKGSKFSLMSIRSKVILLIYLLLDNFSLVDKFKSKVMNIMYKLSEESRSRVIMTKQIRHNWENILNNLQARDDFKLDYSIPSDVLFKKIFKKVDAKCNTKSNWNVVKNGLKDRPRAIGITSKIFSKYQPIGSLLYINGRRYYDFKLTIDILVKSRGMAGVVFRMKDQFNYYAFSIDKSSGHKALIKVVDGKKILLKEVRDGGILINNWHRIEITTTSSHIRVFMYDLEQSKKSSSEKALEVTDSDFASGSAGVFVNMMEGFYFDNFSISSNKCWTPWTPTKSLSINIPMASVYFENFSGTLSEKYKIIESEEIKDGPGEWSMNQLESVGKPLGINQSTKVYDSSSSRRPSMAILKNKFLTNGRLEVSFLPLNGDGIVSIVFKYLQDKTTKEEKFYLFEMVNSQNSSQFVLRKFTNGAVKELYSVNKAVNGLLGYTPSIKHTVQVETMGENIKISLSSGDTPITQVISFKDNSIETGNIGLGTFKVQCNFSLIEIMPPSLTLSEADKSIIMSKDEDEIYFPELEGVKKSNGKANDDGYSTTGNLGDKTNSAITKLDDNLIGWKTCINYNSTKDRNSYCNRTFAIEATREKCKNNFCDTCCDSNVDLSHKITNYVCKKTCSKASAGESNTDDYKSVCTHSQQPLNNIYDYCNNKMNDDESKLSCKLDMCNLCCSTLDSMQHKNYSLETIKNCFKDCTTEFSK